MRGLRLELMLAAGLLTGCAGLQHKPISTVTISPIIGSTSPLDEQVYRGLRDVEAGIEAYKAKVQSGDFHPTPAVASSMALLIHYYNDAYNAWAAYHYAAASTQELTGAALKAKYDLLALQYATVLASGGK